MKILLTGSNGFLGKILKNSFDPNNLKTLSRANADLIVDLTKTIPIFDQSFDVVIHAAGKAHSIPKNDIHALEFNHVNVNGTINLLAAFTHTSIPKQFVYISSVSVYGLTNGENIKEDRPLLAEEPYGKSKIEAEAIVKKWCDDNNVICTILRLPLVVGENPPGNLGAMIRAIKKGYYFNIAGGNAKKSMVLASDIAKFIIKASVVGGTYNLTDGIHPTFKELSMEISKKFGKTLIPNLPMIIANLLALIGDIIGDSFPINSNKLKKITSTLTFDDSKATLAFGWEPTSILNEFKYQHDA